MLAGPPRNETADALMAFGVPIELIEQAAAQDAHIELWPDHMIPVHVFSALLTQWRMGPTGPIGLDYNVLDDRLARRLSITPDDLDAAFGSIQIMEDAALAWFAEQRS